MDRTMDMDVTKDNLFVGESGNANDIGKSTDGLETQKLKKKGKKKKKKKVKKQPTGENWEIGEEKKED